VWAGAVEAAGFHGHEDADLYIVVAECLAREAHLAEQVPAFEHLEFGPGHFLRFAFQVLYPAGRAFGVGTAAVVPVPGCKTLPRAPVTAKPSDVGVTSRRSIR
jgi:hypothetical protein